MTARKDLRNYKRKEQQVLNQERKKDSTNNIQNRASKNSQHRYRNMTLRYPSAKALQFRPLKPPMYFNFDIELK